MQSSPDERPNILLVVLDSVRASNTSLHQYDNETTPFLEQFVDEATWYTQARSPGTESLSSHTSIFTGLNVREHGITDRRQRLEPGHTVWERLSDDGYETGVFSNNPFLTELPVGLDGTFDHVCGRRQEQPYPDAVNPKNFVIDAADRGPWKYVDFVREAVDNGRVAESLLNGLSFKLDGSHEKLLPTFLEPDSSAEQYADQFLAWRRDREDPWAACVNFMDAHYPYEPGSEHDRWGGDELRRIQRQIEDQAWEFVAGDRPWGERRAIEALYDGAIRRMDAAVERIVSGLREAEELEETMIVVTADHGEGFGERSRVRREARLVGHGNGGLPEEVLHVPLLVKYPEQEEGSRCDSLTSLTEFPSAVDAALERDADAESFLPSRERVICSTDGVDPDTAERAREYCGSIAPYDEPADAVYEAEDGTVRKHVRWGDERRTVRVRDAHSAWIEPDGALDVDAVVAELSDADVRDAPGEEVGAEVAERLEDLGYA